MDECINEKLRASADEPGTVQLGNEKRRKTQLYCEAGQQELTHLISMGHNNPTKDGGVEVKTVLRR